MRRASCLALGAAAVLAAGCSSATPAPRFSPSPGGSDVEGNGGVHIDPIEPTPSFGSGSNGAGPNSPRGGSQSPSSSSRKDPLVVATKLTTPTGIGLLPDGSALVGERSTGRIVRVQPVAGKPVPTVRTLTGLSTADGGGLLDLAVSPDYLEDNLIYAYITTPTDNRVVDFTLHGPVTPVLTGIPRGSSDNEGRLAFGADGDLYIATGDAGHPTDAGRATSLAGKILRVTDIGAPARGNPSPKSPVYATGLRTAAGLCASAASENVYEVETHGADEPGEINVVDRGSNYGWPAGTAATRSPLAALPAHYGNPGGCAVQADRLWITSLDGEALLSTALRDGSAPAVGQFTQVLANRYGRLLTVVPAPDGALWITTSNRDGHGNPVPDDERVIRYPPNAVGGAGGKVT